MPVRSLLVGRARAVVVACAAVVVLALATGCEMRVEVAVDVESGGAGSVVVSVGFDDAAVERLGDPAEALALDLPTLTTLHQHLLIHMTARGLPRH